MKKIIFTLTLITSSLAFANDNSTQINYTDNELTPPPPTVNAMETDGPGAQKVPISDYAGLLLVAGVLSAGMFYYNKEKQIIKK